MVFHDIDTYSEYMFVFNWYYGNIQGDCNKKLIAV